MIFYLSHFHTVKTISNVRNLKIADCLDVPAFQSQWDCCTASRREIFDFFTEVVDAFDFRSDHERTYNAIQSLLYFEASSGA